MHECATRDREGDLVLALDGKVLRGAWTDGNKQVKLFAAMIHQEGVVVAQTLCSCPNHRAIKSCLVTQASVWKSLTKNRYGCTKLVR